MRMKWSVNLACISGTSYLGMWQVVQLEVAWGQISGAESERAGGGLLLGLWQARQR